MSEPEVGPPKPTDERARPAGAGPPQAAAEPRPPGEELPPAPGRDALEIMPLAASVPSAPGPGAPPLPSAGTSKPIPQPPAAAAPEAAPAPPPPPVVHQASARKPGWLEERPEVAVQVPRRRLAAQSRRDFLLFA